MSPRPARLRSRAAAALLVIGIGLAGCSEPRPSSTPSPSPSIVSAHPTFVEPTKNVVFPVDPDLLAVLPASVEGLAVVASPEGEASLQDPDVHRIASRGAAAIAVDPSTGDFVYAVILALRPSRFDATAYRDWRDSFDEGACSQAGGVVGNAEAEIGGHLTYIGTCAGGLHTYHTWLTEPGLLVSASAVGSTRLGEGLIAGLRP